MIRRQQLANSDRKRMLFVQEKKLFLRQLAPLNLFPAREPMVLRHQEKKGFPAERMPRQVRDCLRPGRNHQVESPVLELSGQFLRGVLEQLERDFRIGLLKPPDQSRQNIE